jgi:hypothetical protein
MPTERCSKVSCTQCPLQYKRDSSTRKVASLRMYTGLCLPNIFLTLRILLQALERLIKQNPNLLITTSPLQWPTKEAPKLCPRAIFCLPLLILHELVYPPTLHQQPIPIQQPPYYTVPLLPIHGLDGFRRNDFDVLVLIDVLLQLARLLAVRLAELDARCEEVGIGEESGEGWEESTSERS